MYSTFLAQSHHVPILKYNKIDVVKRVAIATLSNFLALSHTKICNLHDLNNESDGY